MSHTPNNHVIDNEEVINDADNQNRSPTEGIPVFGKDVDNKARMVGVTKDGMLIDGKELTRTLLYISTILLKIERHLQIITEEDDIEIE